MYDDGMVLWLDTASKSRLESIFTPGDITATNGEVQLDFVNSLYGSSFSVSFQYPANMSYSEMFNNLNGQQAVKYTVYSTYQVSNLNTNPIDTMPKVDYQINTSGLSSDDNSPEVGKDVFSRFAIQAGANSGQAIYLDIDKMNCSVLGLDELSVSNNDEASSSITKLHAAVDTISKQRGKLGAY
jgi:flagellin-like hook-associated protein FlgL